MFNERSAIVSRIFSETRKQRKLEGRVEVKIKQEFAVAGNRRGWMVGT